MNGLFLFRSSAYQVDDNLTFSSYQLPGPSQGQDQDQIHTYTKPNKKKHEKSHRSSPG